MPPEPGASASSAAVQHRARGIVAALLIIAGAQMISRELHPPRAPPIRGKPWGVAKGGDAAKEPPVGSHASGWQGEAKRPGSATPAISSDANVVVRSKKGAASAAAGDARSNGGDAEGPSRTSGNIRGRTGSGGAGRLTASQSWKGDQGGANDDAVVFLVRPSVATSGAFKHKIAALRKSCAFVRARTVLLLVAAEPGEAVDAEVVTRFQCAGAEAGACSVKAIDVTDAFWGGRPPNWKQIEFRAGPSAPGGYPKWAKKTFSWGYRAMCDFWSRRVFDVPEIAKLQFYMRLDDDSKMHCDGSPDVDPIAEMRRRRSVYGFYKFAYDIVPSHEPWVARYIANHTGATTSPPLVADGAAGRLPYRDVGPFHVPSFYNNFEIARVPFFRSAEVRAFNDAVAASNGIWEYRWGDAVQRYFQLALFLGDDDFAARVWCVPTTSTPGDKAPGAIFYRHGRHAPECEIGVGATRHGPRLPKG